MNYTISNTALWGPIIQFGLIAAAILLANILRRKIPFIRKSLMPTAVLGGFLLLGFRMLNIMEVNMDLLETVTYHGIAIGFIALSLQAKNPDKEDSSSSDSMTAFKSGAVIVSSYLMQGILGLAISLGVAYTVMPDFFKAAGILLPMGYGQGPGQANNVGITYQALGFTGGRSFGLSIAAAGFLSACIVGVIYLNILAKKGLVKTHQGDDISGSVTIDTFQDKGEIPIEESIDKLSVQIALVLFVYLATMLVTWGLSSLAGLLGTSLANTISPILWGFNFIIGSVVAMVVCACMKSLKKAKVMTRQYQNNYLLSRISGLAFDVMIVAGIASISISDLSGQVLPFAIMAISGAIITQFFLMWLCKHAYPGYYHEGLVSMYGMMTGTISSGILLLREIDGEFKTPAANNLITGSSTAIIIGAPMLILIGIAPARPMLTLIIMAIYIVPLLWFIVKAKPRDKAKKNK